MGFYGMATQTEYKIKDINYFAVETFGRWCREALDLVSDIDKQLRGLTCDPRATEFLRQHISIAIQIGWVGHYNNKFQEVGLRRGHRAERVECRGGVGQLESTPARISSDYRLNRSMFLVCSSKGRPRNQIIRNDRLRWAGHLIRMEDSRPAKRVLLNNPGGHRYRGRPRARR
ncbi:hypothetical protein C0J52_18109 [Blattella germanica]|nr:hypothetical protein C0J52_18109 [Blattella germanica]